jgi:hypothetical protein
MSAATWAKTSATTGTPATTPGARATTCPCASWSAGMVARSSRRGPAGTEVFGQGGADEGAGVGGGEVQVSGHERSCGSVGGGRRWRPMPSARAAA